MIPLGRNVNVKIGSDSKRRIAIVDNGENTVHTFDEKGNYFVGEQYQMAPQALDIIRARTGGETVSAGDTVQIGAVGFTYALAPIQNLTGAPFEYGQLIKGNILNIYRRAGDNKLEVVKTIDLLKDRSVQTSLAAGPQDVFAGNVQLFKTGDNNYYMPGALFEDFGSNIPFGAAPENFGEIDAVETYNDINTSATNPTYTKLVQNGTFAKRFRQDNAGRTGLGVICPSSIQYLGRFADTIGSWDYYLHSNAYNSDFVEFSFQFGPCIAVIPLNTLSFAGGDYVGAFAQTYRIVRRSSPGTTAPTLGGAVIQQVGYTDPYPAQEYVGPYIYGSTPAVEGYFSETKVNQHGAALLGNMALPVQTTIPTGIPSLEGSVSYCMMRIGTRYILHEATFPNYNTQQVGTRQIGKAPTFKPLVELPEGTFDAMYCNVMDYTAKGNPIKAQLLTQDTTQSQSATVRTEGAVRGAPSNVVSVAGRNVQTGILRGFNLEKVSLPMSFQYNNEIFDIRSINPVSNQRVDITFTARNL